MTFPVQPTPCTVQSEQAVFPLTSSGQQPPTNTWCKQVMSFKHYYPDNVPVLCTPCVVNRGEHNESPTSLSPSSFSPYFVFSWLIDRVSKMELGFLVVTHWDSRSDSHWISEWAGSQPVSLYDHNPRLISVHRGPISHHKMLHLSKFSLSS